MTAVSRPALVGAAPSSMLGDNGLKPIIAQQSIRRSSFGDYWDFFTPVAFDDLVGANLVLAGPTSGLPDAPTFRALVQNDLPGTINYTPYQDGSVPAGNTVSNTAATTAFASSYVVSANFLTAGSVIRVRARGLVGTSIGAVTFTFRVLYGSTVMLSGTLSVPSGVTNGGFELKGDLIANAVGGGGSFEADGMLIAGNVSSGAGAGSPAGAQGIIGAMMANIAAISAATTTNKAISIDVQMSTAAAAVKAILRQMTVDIIRP